MKIHRKVNKNKNVTKIGLSLRSMGLYFAMLRSKSLDDIFMSDKKKSFYKALNELKRNGLVTCYQTRDHLGRFSSTEYTVML